MLAIRLRHLLPVAVAVAACGTTATSEDDPTELSADATAVPCAVDAQCKATQYCTAKGTCATAPKCQATPGCPADLACIAGSCHRPPPRSCLGAPGCGAGEVCANFVCQPAPLGAVQILVEPGDHARALAAAIAGARASVHMTMYQLDHPGVIDALLAQQRAGHEVKVLLNQRFPVAGVSNAAVFQQLAAAGVEVEWAPSRYFFTHQKSVVIDGTAAWIMTMNATATSSTQNREYLAVDTDPADVGVVEAIFQADWADLPWALGGSLLVSPVNMRSELLALIAGATRSIDIEVEEFSSTAIAQALVERADSGVAVRVALASAGNSTQQKVVAQLKQHGVKVVANAPLYLHAKTLVVDGVRAYVGSANFSTTSLGSNRELGLVVTAVGEIAKIVQAIEVDVAKAKPL